MAVTAFDFYFPEIARLETRSATMRDDPHLPDGDYGFVEFYCDDPACDCQRVIIEVISRRTEKAEATISYGWGTLRHYEKWIGDRATAKQMVGLSLDPLHPQSRYAPALLKLFEWVLQDKAYEARLKQHYALMKEWTAPKAPAQSLLAKSIKKLGFMKRKASFKIGDSVKVKAGIKDPDNPELVIGGWQGRVKEIRDDGIVMVTWDSIALKAMSPENIARYEREGLDWTTMGLDADDYEPAAPRDTKADAATVAQQLERAHQWDGMDDEGVIIKEALGKLDLETADEMDVFDAWLSYLQTHLIFPFEAEVSEFQERGPFKTGDIINVQSIASTDDSDGIIVNLSRKGRRLAFALGDLEATDKKSKNHELVKAYAVWFANK